MKPLKYFLNTTGVIAFIIAFGICGSLETKSISFHHAVIACTISTIYFVVAFVICRLYLQDDYN
jgi:hypothetical protein